MDKITQQGVLDSVRQERRASQPGVLKSSQGAHAPDLFDSMYIMRLPGECSNQGCKTPPNLMRMLELCGIAITGDALGDNVFCSEACAEEWLDKQQGQ